ncbi:hypothetical protein M407DRAFT_243727 [Tulasnella calospora MUT 4182]|uniref:Uncharacterized protein n=1 Tax=Tulasnella calospora MUT 4182 TaxID=1051891 RepID=A0A0C3LYB7_9AGAM|nr:hypothetical protein M407DRAFT_243727 [Tulasnella calospora MUT 4182]
MTITLPEIRALSELTRRNWGHKCRTIITNPISDTSSTNVQVISSSRNVLSVAVLILSSSNEGLFLLRASMLMQSLSRVRHPSTMTCR